MSESKPAEPEKSAKATTKPGRSGNPAKATAAGTPRTVSRTPAKPKRIGNRWAAPAMVACAVIGLVWIVVFYTAGERVPLMSDLGNWNLVVGMGFIVVAFGFSMKWE